MTPKTWIKGMLLGLCLATGQAQAGNCSGFFPNPLLDVCWKCIFPLSIGPMTASFGMEDAGPSPSLLCTCPIPSFPWIRIGMGTGFWEPARMAEIVREPMCSPTLGGITLASLSSPRGTNDSGAADSEKAFYQVHWFIYPLLAWVNLLTNVACLTPESFDVLYITELDPLWADSELTFLIQPDAVLFANPVAQAACAGDCAAATAGFPLDPLFWCSGCQGSMYPLSGHRASHYGGVASSVGETARMAAKLHRQLIAKDTSSRASQCMDLPLPIIKKSQYKTQMVYPIPITFTAHPLGRSTALYQAGKSYPGKGEDFAYLIWRKRLCCMF
ncbi:MAG TPA: conjugal transfer protein [Thiotrichales bacterium]|nr:conjugal transfer protein [Thiotrichales bacterium]